VVLPTTGAALEMTMISGRRAAMPVYNVRSFEEREVNHTRLLLVRVDDIYIHSG
jgi:hypothetical protein